MAAVSLVAVAAVGMPHQQLLLLVAVVTVRHQLLLLQLPLVVLAARHLLVAPAALRPAACWVCC